jgi:hypothetical protein
MPQLARLRVQPRLDRPRQHVLTYVDAHVRISATCLWSLNKQLPTACLTACGPLFECPGGNTCGNCEPGFTNQNGVCVRTCVSANLVARPALTRRNGMPQPLWSRLRRCSRRRRRPSARAHPSTRTRHRASPTRAGATLGASSAPSATAARVGGRTERRPPAVTRPSTSGRPLAHK